MITELNNSWEGSIDKDSSVITRVLRMTMNDLNNGRGTDSKTGGVWILDQIGAPYVFNSNLRLSNISWTNTTAVDPDTYGVYPTAVNRYFDVVYTYSDRGQSDRKRVNQISSWELEWFNEQEEIELSGYKDQSDGSFKTFATEWAAVNSERDIDDAPGLPSKQPKITFQVITYSSFDNSFYFANNIGRVNSTSFIDDIYQLRDNGFLAIGRQRKYDTSGWLAQDDAFMWIYDSFEMQETTHNIFTNTHKFVFNPNTWQKYDLVTHNQYADFDFLNLFTGVTRTDSIDTTVIGN